MKYVFLGFMSLFFSSQAVSAPQSCVKILSDVKLSKKLLKMWSRAPKGSIKGVNSNSRAFNEEFDEWVQLSFKYNYGQDIDGWYVSAILNFRGIERRVTGRIRVRQKKDETSVFPIGYNYQIVSDNGYVDFNLRDLVEIRGLSPYEYFKRRYNVLAIFRKTEHKHFIPGPGIFYSSEWESVSITIPRLFWDRTLSGTELNGLRIGHYDGESVIEGVLEVQWVTDRVESYPIGERYLLRLDNGQKVFLDIDDLLDFRVSSLE